MAEEKKNFIFYTSWKTWLDGMTNEQKGMWLDWVMDYCNDLEPNYPNDAVVKMGCLIARENLKRDLVKYHERLGRMKVARERNPNNNKSLSNNNQTNISQTLDNNQSNISCDNVNDNVNVNDINKEINESINILSKESVEETEPNSQYLCSLFERFWKIYPKKVGKDKCKKWFLVKQHKVDESLLYQMTESIEKWKQTDQWQKDNGQYIPNPLTWLNRKGWEDEVNVSTKSNSSYEKQTENYGEVDLSFIDV